MFRHYAKPFYNSKRWKNTQAAYMADQHYICERCGDVARIVHHKEYITAYNMDDQNITLNWENLEALCIDCHNTEHFSSGKAIADGLMFDETGNVVKDPTRSPPIR